MKIFFLNKNKIRNILKYLTLSKISSGSEKILRKSVFFNEKSVVKSDVMALQLC